MQKKHSGKMGAIALPVALIAAAVGVLLWMLTGAQGYRAADWDDTDGLDRHRRAALLPQRGDASSLCGGR